MEDWGAVRDRAARDIERVGDWDGADHYEDCPAIPHVDHECECPVIENDDDDTADECADRCADKAEEVCDCYLGVMRALRADIRAALKRVEKHEAELAEVSRWRDAEARSASAREEALRQRVEEEHARAGRMTAHAHDSDCEAQKLAERVEELEREQDAMVEEAADALNASIKAALMDEMHDHALTRAEVERLRAALQKLTVDSALQGRVFKGNEELPGAEEFYRAYNAGIKAQFEYACEIARAALQGGGE